MSRQKYILITIFSIVFNLFQYSLAYCQCFSNRTELKLLNDYLKELGYLPFGFTPSNIIKEELLTKYYRSSISGTYDKVMDKYFKTKDGAIRLSDLDNPTAIDSTLDGYLFQELLKSINNQYVQVDSVIISLGSKKYLRKLNVGISSKLFIREYRTNEDIEARIRKISNLDSSIKLYEALLVRLSSSPSENDRYFKYSYFEHKVINLLELNGDKKRERLHLINLAFQVKSSFPDFYLSEKALKYYLKAYNISKTLNLCTENYYDKCNIVNTLIEIKQIAKELRQRTNLDLKDWDFLEDVILVLIKDLMRSKCSQNRTNIDEANRVILAYIINEFEDYSLSQRLYLLSAINAHLHKDGITFNSAIYQLAKNFWKYNNVTKENQLKRVLDRFDSLWTYIYYINEINDPTRFFSEFTRVEKYYYLFKQTSEWLTSKDNNFSHEKLRNLLYTSIYRLNRSCNKMDSIGSDIYLDLNSYHKKKDEWRAETANYLDKYIISIQEPQYIAWMADSTNTLDSLHNYLLQYTTRSKETFGYSLLHRANSITQVFPYWRYEEILKGELTALKDELAFQKDQIISQKEWERNLAELKRDSSERAGNAERQEKLLVIKSSEIAKQRSALIIVSIIAVFSILGILFSFVHFRIRARKYKMALMVNKASINSHFIRNLISGPLGVRLERTMNEEIIGIKNNISVFIDAHYEYSKQEDSTLMNEIEYLDNYMALEYLRYSRQLKGIPKVQILNISDDELYWIKVPTVFIQPFVENAFKRGLKGTDNVIDVIFSKVLDVYYITVSDSGYGMSEDELKKYNNFKTTDESEHAHAINTCLSRMHNYNRSKHVSSKLNCHFHNNVMGGLTVIIELKVI